MLACAHRRVGEVVQTTGQVSTKSKTCGLLRAFSFGALPQGTRAAEDSNKHTYAKGLNEEYRFDDGYSYE